MKRIIAFTIFVLCTSALAQETNSLLIYYRSAMPLTLVDPAKASDITNGVTFKKIVDDLGPGWRHPDDGVGLVSWTFKDGRRLDVRLPHYIMVEGRAKQTPMIAAHYHWWTNTPTETSADPNPQPRFLRY